MLAQKRPLPEADNNFKSYHSFLYGFYTDTHNSTMDEVLAELRQSAPENINDFYEKTFHSIDINQCRFLNLPCDKDFRNGPNVNLFNDS